MDDEELMEFLEEADRDGDGELNQDDFYKIMKNSYKKDDVE